MKLALTVKTKFLPLTLLASLMACGSDDSKSSLLAQDANPTSFKAQCASARALQPGQSPAVFSWNTLESFEVLLEDPNSDTQIGRQLIREVRRSWNPLNGSGYHSRKPCSRLYVETRQGGERRFLDREWQPGVHMINHFLPEAGYALGFSMGILYELPTENFLIKLQAGQRRIVTSHPGQDCPVTTQLYPSPSAKYLALVTTTGICGNEAIPQPTKLNLQTIDGTPFADSYDFAFRFGALLEWPSDDLLMISDGDGQGAQTLNLDLFEVQ